MANTFQINDRAVVLPPFSNSYPGVVVITGINTNGDCQINGGVYIMVQYLGRPDGSDLV
jgi:hypothetical protein